MRRALCLLTALALPAAAQGQPTEALDEPTETAVDNLLDSDYEEAIGFPAVGVRPRAGATLRY